MSRPVIVRDVSNLPTYAFGTRNILWWGNLFFMVIEGLGVVFAVATYLYLYSHNESWPLGPQPSLLWPSVVLGWLLLSEIPNVWLKKAAARLDLKNVRRGLVIMCAFGLVAIVMRSLELRTLHIRWDDNAYGSIVWFLTGLQMSHLIIDVIETLVMTTCLHIGPVDKRRFSDVLDNQDYWHFVVALYFVIYITICWLPRWFEVSP